MASQEREQARSDSDVSWNPWGDVMFNVRPEVRNHYYGSGTCNPEIYQVDGAAEHSSEVEPDLTSPPVTASDSGALNKSLSLGQVVSCGTQISTLGRVSTDGIGRRACTEVPPWSGRQPPTPQRLQCHCPELSSAASSRWLVLCSGMRPLQLLSW